MAKDSLVKPLLSRVKLNEFELLKHRSPIGILSEDSLSLILIQNF